MRVRKIILITLVVILSLTLVHVSIKYITNYKIVSVISKLPLNDQLMLNLLPEPLVISNPSSADSPYYTHRELRFVSPWGSQTGIKKIGDISVLEFDKVFVSIVEQDSIIASFGLEEQEKLEHFYGAEVIESNRVLYDLVFNLQTKDVSIRQSIKVNVKNTILLTYKSNMLSGQAAEGFYEFTSKHIQGYQIGGAESQAIILEVFDTGNKHYRLSVSGSSQDELNLFLGSLRFTE